MLRFALRDIGDEAAVDQALESLSRKSVALFKRYAESYALWEGSDIDIELRTEMWRYQVDREQPLAAFLMRTLPPPPLIARRHYFQKGTLRYFETSFADVATLKRELSRNLGQADGRVVMCLPLNAEERYSMAAMLRTPGEEVPASVLAALPHDVLDLRHDCYELICLHWVFEHTPELEADRTAHRELHTRLTHAEQGLRSHLDQVFLPHTRKETSCTWYFQGKAESIRSPKDVNHLLSRVCDEVYPSTPVWRNGAINRRNLSSAAAAARGRLVAAMIENGAKPNLGFVGVPPERCMYETLLKGSLLHKEKDGVWGFYPPDARSEPALRAIWKTIERYLADTEAGKLPLERLYDALRQPPFGLKDGVVPILLAAACFTSTRR